MLDAHGPTERLHSQKGGEANPTRGTVLPGEFVGASPDDRAAAAQAADPALQERLAVICGAGSFPLSSSAGCNSLAL